MIDAKKNNQYFFSSFQGIFRKENQDSLVVIDEAGYLLLAVFDGVGGAMNGKAASEFAKNFVEQNYSKYLDEIIKVDKLMYDLNEALTGSGIYDAYTTYCVLFLQKNKELIYYSWLGDSRIYEITTQLIKPITIDDSAGFNVITKCLGDEKLTPDDFRLFSMTKENKQFLLCTDGFYHVMEEDKFSFHKAFHLSSLNEISEKIESLVKGKNEDDCTYLFVV